METLLAEKQSLIDSKEEDLVLLKERLRKLETGLTTPVDETISSTEKEEEKDDHSSNMQQQEKAAAAEEEIKRLKEHIDTIEKERDTAFLQLKESANLLEEEKAMLTRKQEEAEEILRENMEKLREKLESEKQVLSNCIFEKETEIKRIKKEMDELRESIQVCI